MFGQERISTRKGEKMMNRYVVGFAFDEYQKAVILIEKSHPEWQKGKWNGIGGKIKLGESPLQAMVREAREETGILNDFKWKHYATMRGDDFECFVFCGMTKSLPNVEVWCRVLGICADSGELLAWHPLPLVCPRIRDLDFLIEAGKICYSFKHIEITYELNGDISSEEAQLAQAQEGGEEVSPVPKAWRYNLFWDTKECKFRAVDIDIPTTPNHYHFLRVISGVEVVDGENHDA